MWTRRVQRHRRLPERRRHLGAHRLRAADHLQLGPVVRRVPGADVRRAGARHTPEDRAAAFGMPFNTEELISRAKKNFEEFGQTYRWRREWRRQQRHWNRQFRHMNEQMRMATAQAAPRDRASRRAPSAASSLPIAALIGAVLCSSRFILSLFSLITQHSIFGWDLPHGMPLWVAIVALVLIYIAISTPLRMVRHGGQQAAGHHPGWGALHGLLWIGFAVLLFWVRLHVLSRRARAGRPADVGREPHGDDHLGDHCLNDQALKSSVARNRHRRNRTQSHFHASSGCTASAPTATTSSRWCRSCSTTACPRCASCFRMRRCARSRSTTDTRCAPGTTSSASTGARPKISRASGIRRCRSAR